MSKITININATRSPPPKTNTNGNWIWIAAIAIASYYYPQLVPHRAVQTTETQATQDIAQTPTPNNPPQTSSKNYILPVKGRISSGFGMRAHPILKHKSGRQRPNTNLAV